MIRPNSITIRGHKYPLSEWAPEGLVSTEYWNRRFGDYYSIGLMCLGHSPIVWKSYGKLPIEFFNTYRKFYPHDPYFTDAQLEEAKDHIDEFIGKFNRLAVFL